MVGQTLGHYRIVEKIGAGGMGEVYRAHDEKLERDVAIKVLPVGMLSDETARKRFRKEALALAKLNHPNVETIYEFATQDGVDFLAMELIAGLTLGQKLTGGPLTDQEVLKLGAQIAEALNAAHEQGVVHCDLKPGNVMVMSSGHAKVLDFGLAKFFHTSKDPVSTQSLTETQAAGTLPYMSPEQVRGDRVDARTDIYAAGAVLYEMSTGQRPFPETQAPRLIDAILHQEPPPPSAINKRVTPGFDGVVLKSLDKHPERRYQSARELAVDLGRLSSPALPVAATRRRTVTRPWRTAAVTAGVVAILVLATFLIHHIWVPQKTVAVAHPTTSYFPGGKRLAILPFEVKGDQASLDYVADGLVESLYDRLFQLSSLNVASTKASRKIEPGESLEKLVRALGINLVLRGFVSGTSEKLQVMLSLQSVTEAAPFWTKEFSGKTLDLRSLEEQIYEQLLPVLAISENEDERFRAVMRPALRADAYELYLQGREKLSRRQDKSDPTAATHFFDQALKKDRNLDLAYVGLADANLMLDREKKNKLFLQRAVDAAQRAVRLDEASPTAHSTLGEAYRATGRYPEAIVELKRSVSLAPSSDEGYRRLGEAYMASGNGMQAIESFRKAVQLNPYYWDNQNELGNAYYNVADYPKALEAFKQVTILEPDIGVGYENIGNVFLQQGKYPETIPYYQKALQIEPYFSTYSNLGFAYFSLKQYANAVEVFEKAVRLNRNDTLTFENMADSYRWLGKQDKARAAYQEAISLGYKELQANPRDASVMAQIALSYAKTGDAQQAETYLHRARAIDKSNPNYAYDEAEIHAILGNRGEALEALQEAFEKHYPAQFAASDPELTALQSEPEFRKLIERYSPKKP
jgi:tetratricopeptide (TPR) repeat protein/TolB-like protein